MYPAMPRFVRFPTTFWSTIHGRPDRAKSEVFTRYRAPIFSFILNQGFQESDAEDLTQEVFSRVCREEFLQKADADRGRFRSLLLSVTRHVILHERDRRRRRDALSIDEAQVQAPSPAEADPGFDRLWIQNLLTLALQRLKAEERTDGPRWHDAIVLHKLQGLDYEATAARLGCSTVDIGNWIRQAKIHLRRHLEDLIREYCSSDAEWDEEVDFIFKAFP